MSYKVDFGGWGSIFAVPTSVVDDGLKLASDSQIKVLLYMLRHSGDVLSDEMISQSLSIHPDDVRDSIEYWQQKGIVAFSDEIVTMPQKNEVVSAQTAQSSAVEPSQPQPAQITEQKSKTRPVSRATKPEPGYVAKRLRGDDSLRLLMSEAERVLSKVLSNSDVATLVMLHDTDGLPVEVVLMLLQHCAQIGKGNMRYIERTGISWAAEGITTLSLAEEKIKRYSESSRAFDLVSVTFGMRNSGTPTKKQLEFADTWVNEWKFTEDMLRLAYERCVDTKGELNLSYVNGILRRWHESGFVNRSQVLKADEAAMNKSQKKTKKSASADASYDIDEYESFSIFDN